MSSATVPTGGLRELSRPADTQSDGETLSVRYRPREVPRAFSIPLPATPPDDLLLDVEAAVEGRTVFMNARELGVSVEADGAYAALAVLIESIGEWLEYLREENPRLAPELEQQRRYVELLDYEPVTWFRRLVTA